MSKPEEHTRGTICCCKSSLFRNATVYSDVCVLDRTRDVVLYLVLVLVLEYSFEGLVLVLVLEM